MKKALVLGGSGYVGKEICKYALSTKSYEVTSMSRTGNPNVPWGNKVHWESGDIFQNPEKHFQQKNVVISTLGAFGSNEFMNKICGDANILAMQMAEKGGADHFVFISSSRVDNIDLSPSNPMYGYFHGKWRAEQELKKIFGDNGIILRPGFVYGSRQVGSISIPLQWIGSPLSYMSTKCGGVSSALRKIPFFGEELYSFVPVEFVAKVAIDSIDFDDTKSTLFMPEDIRKYGI